MVVTTLVAIVVLLAGAVTMMVLVIRAEHRAIMARSQMARIEAEKSKDRAAMAGVAMVLATIILLVMAAIAAT